MSSWKARYSAALISVSAAESFAARPDWATRRLIVGDCQGTNIRVAVSRSAGISPAAGSGD